MKSKPWEAPIPKQPKFKDRKRLFMVIEVTSEDNDEMEEFRILFDMPLRYVLHGEEWLSREEEIMYALKGYRLELISSTPR